MKAEGQLSASAVKGMLLLLGRYTTAVFTSSSIGWSWKWACCQKADVLLFHLNMRVYVASLMLSSLKIMYMLAEAFAFFD